MHRNTSYVMLLAEHTVRPPVPSRSDPQIIHFGVRKVKGQGFKVISCISNSRHITDVKSTARNADRSRLCDRTILPTHRAKTHARVFLNVYNGALLTLRASEAAAQCIVIGPVCGFVCVFVWVSLFVGLLPR